MKYTKEERLDIVIRSDKDIGYNVSKDTNVVVFYIINSECWISLM